MSIWNGVIVPRLQKSYSYSVVPLKDMTPELWRWLDYGNLRETAKNRLAKAARKGVTGFFVVDVIQKAGPAKGRYLVPAFKGGDDEPNFENSPDDDNLDDDGSDLEGVVDGILGMRPGLPWTTIGGGLLWHVLTRPENEPGPPIFGPVSPPPELPTPEQVEGAPGLSEQDEQDLTDLIELIESGSLDNLEDIDAALQIALYLFDKLPENGDLLDIVESLEESLTF